MDYLDEIETAIKQTRKRKPKVVSDIVWLVVKGDEQVEVDSLDLNKHCNGLGLSNEVIATLKDKPWCSSNGYQLKLKG